MIEVNTISDASIATAVRRLRLGKLVAFPTETVYGLGADATNASAVAQIFVAKRRPEFNPLISHVASLDAAFELGIETPIATSLANAFWPGPLTLILKRKTQCPVALLATAGLDKIGIRVPAHQGTKIALCIWQTCSSSQRQPIRANQPQYRRSCCQRPWRKCGVCARWRAM